MRKMPELDFFPIWRSAKCQPILVKQREGESSRSVCFRCWLYS